MQVVILWRAGEQKGRYTWEKGKVKVLEQAPDLELNTDRPIWFTNPYEQWRKAIPTDAPTLACYLSQWGSNKRREGDPHWQVTTEGIDWTDFDDPEPTDGTTDIR